MAENVPKARGWNFNKKRVSYTKKDEEEKQKIVHGEPKGFLQKNLRELLKLNSMVEKAEIGKFYVSGRGHERHLLRCENLTEGGIRATEVYDMHGNRPEQGYCALEIIEEATEVQIKKHLLAYATKMGYDKDCGLEFTDGVSVWVHAISKPLRYYPELDMVCSGPPEDNMVLYFQGNWFEIIKIEHKVVPLGSPLESMPGRSITVRQLKEWIKDWPEVNSIGEDSEVWLEDYDSGLSDQCKSVWKLNETDIVLKP